MRAINRGEKIWFDPENGMGNGTVKAFDPQNETVKPQNDPQNRSFAPQNETSDPQKGEFDPQNGSLNGTKETVSDTVEDSRSLEDKIIGYIKENRNVTKEVMAANAGVSRSTLQRVLRKMSYVHYVGTSKCGHWEIWDKEYE